MTHYSNASHNTLVPIHRALTFLFVLPALLILCFSSTVLSSPLLLALAHIHSLRSSRTLYCTTLKLLERTLPLTECYLVRNLAHYHTTLTVQ